MTLAVHTLLVVAWSSCWGECGSGHHFASRTRPPRLAAKPSLQARLDAERDALVALRAKVSALEGTVRELRERKVAAEASALPSPAAAVRGAAANAFSARPAAAAAAAAAGGAQATGCVELVPSFAPDLTVLEDLFVSTLEGYRARSHLHETVRAAWRHAWEQQQANLQSAAF